MTNSPPVRLIRRRNARRYILRVRENGEVRVTVPQGGSNREALALVDKHRVWVESQLRQHARATGWTVGGRLLFRGVDEIIGVRPAFGAWEVRVGTEVIPSTFGQGDFRPAIELRFRRLAQVELPARTRALAAAHGLNVRRVTVRDQRTRWGSCSATGRISLNWRLVQMPDAVRDYVILHELAHLRVLNHSPKFWSLVAAFCPNYAAAERWLKENGRRLR